MTKHPSKTLIEQEAGGKTLRIVERNVTPIGLAWGLSASSVCIIAEKLPDHSTARKMFNGVKGVGL